jgi:hypothetical protein
MNNPFVSERYGAGVQAYDAMSRIYMVQSFTREQCRAGLRVSGLQKTVKSAIERRLRALGGKVVKLGRAG